MRRESRRLVLLLATSRSLGWPARETCFVVIAILSSNADDASQIGSPASGLPTYAGISSGEGTAAHYRVHLPAACASAEASGSRQSPGPRGRARRSRGPPP